MSRNLDLWIETHKLRVSKKSKKKKKSSYQTKVISDYQVKQVLKLMKKRFDDIPYNEACKAIADPKTFVVAKCLLNTF